MPNRDIPFAVTTIALSITIPAIHFLRSRPRTTVASRLSFHDQVVFLLGSYLLHLPLPKNIDKWRITDTNDPEKSLEELYLFKKTWKYLEPFFASHGYTLYQFRKGDLFLTDPAPPAKGLGNATVPTYPYARRIRPYADQEVDFSFNSVSVFAATDAYGHDVVIKAISDGTPSNELKIMKFLNTKEARSDSRNHTIPVIEFLTFDKFTFVVMPRWDSVVGPEFTTIDEILWYAQSILEAFDFLHENRIVHYDFLEQNMGMNLVVEFIHSHTLRDVRDRATIKYALIDFGHSMSYPLDTVIEDVRETRFFGFSMRGLPEPEGPYNPFQAEMLSVGKVLQRRVRHIEGIIPEFGPFFDQMMEEDPRTRLTARQALEKFYDIFASLSKTQLESKVVNKYWENGVYR